MDSVSERLARRLPWLMAAAAALLYLPFPAARYNFDGVACAIAVELGNPRYLVHGNHVAYGLLGYAWFSLWKAVGYHGPSIFALQAMSSLLSAGAAGAFALLALRCGAAPVEAALGAAGLAVSGVYWSWALESQVYPLGAFFLFLAAAEAFREKPRAIRLGLLHAGAIFGHVGHAMFAPAAAYLLRRDDRFWPMSSEDRKELASYGVVLGGAVMTGYLIAICLVWPKSWEALKNWFLGSSAINASHSFGWHGGYSLSCVLDWLEMSARLWTGEALAGCALWALAVYGAFKRGGGSRIVRGLGLWLAGYAVLYSSWEPATPVYRITDLAPLWVLILLGAAASGDLLARGRSPLPRGGLFSARAALSARAGLAAGVLSLAAWNWSRHIRPHLDPLDNPDLQRALWIERQTPANAWIAADGPDQVYVPYFAHRRPVNLRFYVGREAALGDKLKGHFDAGEPVFVVLNTVPPEWRAWLEAYGLREVARRGGDALFRVGAS